MVGRGGGLGGVTPRRELSSMQCNILVAVSESTVSRIGKQL